jgi:hypothetical protein
VFGSVANPDAGDDGSESCANGGCGLVGNTPDGSDVSDADIDHVVVGVAPCADAACGSMVNPDAGTD